MALEASTSAISSNVQGIQAPKDRNTIFVNRDSRSASNPFAPQTNVLLKNAISNMQNILSNAAELQNSEVDELPIQIQKMVQNILEKSFSLENTLAEGISSTVESQRFSADNLNALARILTQLSLAAEKGNSLEISDNLQALLKNIKAYTTNNDDSFEPVMLHKLSFQLLDGKNIEELSALLQSVLQTSASELSLTEDIEHGSNLLKQLMKAFMPPRINTWNGDKPVLNEQKNLLLNEFSSNETTSLKSNNDSILASNTNNTAQNEKGTTPTRQTTVLKQETEKSTVINHEDKTKNNFDELSQQTANTTKQTSQDSILIKEKSLPESFQENNHDNSTQKTDQNLTLQIKKTEQKDNNTQNLSETKNSSYDAESTENNKQLTQQSTQQTKLLDKNNSEFLRFKTPQPEKYTGNVRTSFTSSGDLKNSAETMNTMKSLADLLLKDAQLSEKDTLLLQNFVNGKNDNLSEKEAKQLQLLLKLCENNIPASVKQASNHPELRDLPKLWAFMELCDLASLKEKKAYKLKKAAKTVTLFANSMKNALSSSEGTNTEKGKSLSFTMPLYMGDAEKIKYPAYIHIYHDTTDENEAGMTGQTHDTWLRICCLTENIGAVELTCHLFDESRVDINLNFSQESASTEFKEYLPDFKSFMQGTNLSLNSFKIKS